ncbi:MAG: cadherin-like domain-containing protein [Thermoproteota archaeon]
MRKAMPRAKWKPFKTKHTRSRIKRDVNGNIVLSLQQQLASEYAKLQSETFSQLPSIQKWITYLKSGKVPATRIRYMTNIIHGISDQLMVMLETLVSHGVPIDAAKRKEIAIEYRQNFLAWFNTAYPQMQRTNTIIIAGILNNTLTGTIENDCGGIISGMITGFSAEDVCEPVSDGQSATTDEDTGAPITITETDPEVAAGNPFENAQLTFFIMAQPENDTLALAGGNTTTSAGLTYTPDANFTGIDSFTFIVNDGTASSTAATVSITVNPVAEQDNGNGGGGGGGGGNRVVIVNNNNQQSGGSVTTFPDSHFEDNPLDRMSATGQSFLDARGASITQAGAGQQVSISATISNHQETEQEYAFIVQITDGEGNVVYISWKQGTIGGGQSSTVSTVWTPEAAGTYSPSMFVWNRIGAAPEALPQMTEMEITVS